MISAKASEEVSAERWPATYLLILAVGCALVLWLLPLRSSLSLDELGSYWTVKEGFRQAFHRSLEFQGESPMYYLLLAAVVRFVGRSELIMRIPSLLAMGVAAWATYRVGLRLLDRVAATLAALIFVVLSSTGYFAGAARPYAVATAAFTAATLVLIRWLDEGHTRDAALYSVLAAVTIYAHVVFAVAFMAHGIYLYARREDVERRGYMRLVAIVAGAGLLCVPIASQISSIARRGKTLSVPFDIVGYPKPYIFAVLLVPFVVFMAGAVMRRTSSVSRDVWLIVAWSAITPALFVLVSLSTSWNLLWGRYYFPATPGFALLAGWVLAGIRRYDVGVVCAVLAAAAGLALASTHHSPERWREAIARTNTLTAGRRSAVLLRGGFIESRQIGWLTEPRKRSWLLAPVDYYTVSAPTDPLLFDVDTAFRERFVSLLADSVKTNDRVVVISNYGGAYSVLAVVESRLAGTGFHRLPEERYGDIVVTVFDRISG
ncbi:MAG: glycosyltransferase family 39 protein [Actinomycetota bacterium]|nr:glycosyltransferase family 39 protein [Actinomycetota bacterium]